MTQIATLLAAILLASSSIVRAEDCTDGGAWACKNDGACEEDQEDGGAWKCFCTPDQWVGPTCETHVVCETYSLCQHGGVCQPKLIVDESNGNPVGGAALYEPTCDCSATAGFEGEFCQIHSASGGGTTGTPAPISPAPITPSPTVSSDSNVCEGYTMCQNGSFCEPKLILDDNINGPMYEPHCNCHGIDFLGKYCQNAVAPTTNPPTKAPVISVTATSAPVKVVTNTLAPVVSTNNSNNLCSNECQNGDDCRLLKELSNAARNLSSCTCPTTFAPENGNICDACNVQCQNGSTCSTTTVYDDVTNAPVGLQPACDCVQGYQGVYCEVHPSEYPTCTTDCGLHGQCVVELEYDVDGTWNGQYKEFCECTSGWLGTHCDKKCDLNCQNGGVCQLSTSAEIPTCKCGGKFSGDLCQHCNFFTCKNGGTCHGYPSYGEDNGLLEQQQLSWERKCDCTEGFRGKHCDVPLCDSITCNNGGTCVQEDRGKGETCECTDKFAGETCDIPMVKCDANAGFCYNGGKCNYVSGGTTTSTSTNAKFEKLDGLPHHDWGCNCKHASHDGKEWEGLHSL